MAMNSPADMLSRFTRVGGQLVMGVVLGVTSRGAQGLPVELFPLRATPVRATIRTDSLPERVTGSFVRGTPDQIVIETPEAEVLTIREASLMALEQKSRDRWRGALKGLGFGAVGGALLGGISSVIQNDPGPYCELVCSTSEEFVLGAVLGVALGASLGTIVGALVGSERWVRVW
jgi:hypothetical protein